tara:strand:- start:143 stop:1021 length:879 start_codon:yes stop_codon:yes gene_type:complete
MKKNICEVCNFSTNLKANYLRHLNTKKHKKNVKNYEEELEKSSNLTHKNTQKHTNIPFLTHKNTQKHTKTHKNVEKSEHICEFCNKSFSRLDSLTRHINKNFCKMIKKQYNEDALIMQLEEHKKERNKLYDYIDKLIDKTGNTNINIEKQMNNQINLNNFGEEDISHITDDYKMKMLTLPYGMIQNMIEKVHFNNKKPENKNIALTNKRENMIRVFRRKRWKFQDRFYVVDELIKNNYNRLDEYYEEYGKMKMNAAHNRRYQLFQKKFDRQDDELMNKIKRETEMILLSENL